MPPLPFAAQGFRQLGVFAVEVARRYFDPSSGHFVGGEVAAFDKRVDLGLCLLYYGFPWIGRHL